MTTEAVPLEVDETSDPHFSINSLALADWALQKIAEHQALMAENERLFQAKLERLEAAIAKEKLRLEEINKGPARDSEFLTNHLRLFAELSRDTILKGSRKKSRALPSGTIGWRTKPASLEVKDEAKMLAWARAQKDTRLLRLKPAWSVIKERCLKTGEIPDGCEAIPEVEVFEVKPEASNDS